MSESRFDSFFTRATKLPRPFDYQRRLACGEQGGRPESDWLSGGAPYQSRLINIPTGLGKTAAVVVAWLWNRVAHPNGNHRTTWPRRLLYCLPMRTLVEQTSRNVCQWIEALEVRDRVGVHVLMGGEEAGDWDIYPEENAILIGTQDMLLSRALNRGYGMSRYRWPMHFGLLNNDCLWVMDEVQLMGPGVSTTAQLAQFREGLCSIGECSSWWMSATLEQEWLKTVDFDPSKLSERITLSAEDHAIADVEQRWTAHKPVHPATHAATDTKKLGAEIVGSAATDGITLVVVNTVERACVLCEAIASAQKKSKSSLPPPILIHSRFRPPDRKEKVDALLTREGTAGIVVSTQVVEAGVDVSAKVLFTEVAPWPALVQRFGRCNRRGEFKEKDEPRVFWINLDPEKSAAPYEKEALLRSRERLEDLSRSSSSASPATLANIPIDSADRPRSTHVLRRKDLIELFDTTPDLAGNDIDVDRYIRDADARTVQVFWRRWDQKSNFQPPETGTPPAAAPERHELCPAPTNFRDSLPEGIAVFTWDYLEREWRVADSTRLLPGHNYLLHVSAGCYSKDKGWNPESREEVEDVRRADEIAPPEDNDSDQLSETRWQSIAEHTGHVVAALESILNQIPISEREALELAARWHDRGKSHEQFQNAVREECRGELRPEQWRGRRDLAKAPGRDSARNHPGWWRRYAHKHFRHELASALAVLHPDSTVPQSMRDLVAYLAAAHHGKVRVSLRSLPGECSPPDERRFARGVWDSDKLPAVDLGNGVAPEVTLSLEPMEIGECEGEPFVGQPSWLDRVLRLRDSLGLFRLAFYESLLRAADERASVIRRVGENGKRARLKSTSKKS